ncbi:SH3 and cysteine-rich domain-containing protein isoform X2 [Ptiloglossa arizonensis]|uniref:SH3 and cysteine-rich domain-containing protein isoform X2 n=1 Tax=Ptiloglossa arizonensis TaxID=3350558 RepID=UPI003F9FB39F
MYVIYPADELLRIYENPIRDPRSVLTGDRTPSCQITVIALSERNERHEEDRKRRKERRRNDRGQTRRRRARRNEPRDYQVTRDDTRPGDDTRTMQNSRGAAGEDAVNPLKDLTQPGLNEPLKQHNAGALKLVQTVSEFAQELGAAMENHSANVRRLVDEFRGRSGDTRIDSGGMRRVWENLLRQVEADAVAHLDLAAVLQQQLSRPTLEASFHRKLQSRKVFAHREAYEQVVAKSEEKLQRARADYKRAYAALLTIDGGGEQELKRVYFEAHNAYVLQLRATNAITERYQSQCLPGLLGEIAEVYEELCGLACKCVAGISEAAAERAGEQAKRYQAVAKEAQIVMPLNDLQVLARSLSATATPSKKPSKRLFVAPGPPEQVPMERINQIPSLRDELAPTTTSTLPLMEDLRREHDGLYQEIARLHDALDALIRMQRKSAESNLYTKVAELQEDISMKRFELGEAQLYLAAVQAQKELFGGGEAGQPDGVSSRKMSNGSTGSTKHKWLKAFKSLKTSSPTTPPSADKKSLESEGGHTWREYTYRKITPCDACGQVLRGHSRQGVRCRGCKANAHTDCIHLVQPAMCPSLAPKKSGGIPLLRRQKTQAPVDDTPAAEHTPHSPQRRRERLNLRMKSLSLDSPEGTAHGRHRPRDYCPGGQRESTPPRHSDSGSINRLSPCSPGQGHGVHKHIRGAIRMSSMELPDENEKSYSSASTSPCPSPHTNNQNHMNPPGKRVLPPNNLYVALYNFDARHRDELDLKAGYKVTVIDKSEKDWWKGKCLGGRVGYFPSAYVMRVESGQKTLQVTRNLHLTDQITLLRDQIVIQVGEEVDGVAMVRCAADVRSADHTGKEGEVLYKETLCPLKYLQEV